MQANCRTRSRSPGRRMRWVSTSPAMSRVSSSPDAYHYLAQSILAWPDRATVADWMRAAGLVEVQVKDLAGGIVAVHRGFLP